MEPIEQIQVFVFILIAGFRSKSCCIRSFSGAVVHSSQEHLIDQAGCLAVCRIVGTDERTVGSRGTAVCNARAGTNVFVVDLVIIIMIIEACRTAGILPYRALEVRNERAPDIQAGNHVFGNRRPYVC